jgi:hypothetical protein
MTTEQALRQATPSRRARMLARVAILLAKIISRQTPHRIRRLLSILQRGARPASHTEAAAAIEDVVAVSLVCAGQGCLQRSIAAALLCRFRGRWATWATGVRVNPFAAHAWLEVDGQPISEPYAADYFKPMIRVTAPDESQRSAGERKIRNRSITKLIGVAKP